MSKYLLPTMGAAGTITLKAPFEALCVANVPYRVSELRSLAGILAAGEDAYAAYYAPYDIDRTTFNQDVQDGVVIVSLLSPEGEPVQVPNSYLVSLPVATGIPYAGLMVGINLGAMPLDLNLTYFMSRVKELAHDLLGVNNAQARAVKATSTTYLTVDDANAIETARKTIMAEVVTTEAKLLQSEQARIALQTKNADLEAYILKHHKPE